MYSGWEIAAAKFYKMMSLDFAPYADLTYSELPELFGTQGYNWIPASQWFAVEPS